MKTDTNDIGKEIAARINARNGEFTDSKKLSRKIKLGVYNSLIKLVVLYGSKT